MSALCCLYGEEMSTKIFVMTHRNFDVPKESSYIPLQVGKAVNADLGYLGDNTGDNISAKNCYYSELTGLYWVAKNIADADYLGLCHYRRFFLNEEGALLSEQQCEEILEGCDIILPRAVYHRKPYYEVYKEAHNIHDLDVTGEVLRELYPDMYEIFHSVIRDDKVYSGNLFITSREHFCEYAMWLFSIFNIVEQRIYVEEYDAYHKRVFGFLSEQLLYVWVKSRRLKICELPVGLTQEKAETIELKQKIRETMQKADLQSVQEALALFRSSMKDRPDLMLQASDLSGELEDMFRILYICEQELLNGQVGMLAITTDMNNLIKHYRLIERILLHILEKTVTQKEIEYFKDAKVSAVLFRILINNNAVLKAGEEVLSACFL